jgi:hypothetical protein
MKTKNFMLVSLRMTGWYKRIILPALALILISGSLSAQGIRVSGTVTDNTGMPVPGVTVLIEGTTTGVATGNDGTYSLTVPADGVLLFSAIGMETQRIAVNNRTVINVTMAESAIAVEEVVVTALGIEKRGKLLDMLYRIEE